jgi:hypothetical protein
MISRKTTQITIIATPNIPQKARNQKTVKKASRKKSGIILLLFVDHPDGAESAVVTTTVDVDALGLSGATLDLLDLVRVDDLGFDLSGLRVELLLVPGDQLVARLHGERVDFDAKHSGAFR